MGVRTVFVYSSKGYLNRAEECVRLANLAADELVRSELLKLRQTYLKAAERLKTIEAQKPN